MKPLHLHRREDLLHQTLEMLPAGAFACDASGLITSFNQRAVGLLGREPKLNDPDDRFLGLFKMFTTEGAPIAREKCWMALALRDQKVYHDCEMVLERPNGQRWTALAQSNPFFDDDGRLAGAVNVLVDITEHKAAATARWHLSAIVDSSDDAIVSKNLDGVVQTWNRAAERLFGYSADQAVGRHISFLIPPDREDEEELILRRLRAGERIYHFDTVRLRHDGTPIDISLTISPVRDERGKIVGASKIARDISHRKRIETKNYELVRQLKEADYRKNEFLAMLGHELRNPLNPIRNAVEMLRLGGSDDPDLTWCIEVIDRQVVHLVRLIDDLLDIGRITRNQLELRRERTNLQTVVEGAVELSRPLIEENGHDLQVRLPQEPIELNADVVRLSQVLMNLLNNAAKYTERGGQIRLTADRDGDEVVVSVQDTGIGIPPDKVHRLFEMFYQVDECQERSQGGLGIGLALVQRLVEMHGGTVVAQSEGLGSGTEMLVRLPVLTESGEVSLAPTDKSDRASSVRRILVVDDNRDAASSLAMLLTFTGNEIEMAYDGQHALEVTESFRPDVVLLDIGLPRLSGYDVARQIRKQTWGQEMLLIALTGWGQEEDLRQSREAGFDHHMVKPVDHLVLKNLLDEIRPAGV